MSGAYNIKNLESVAEVSYAVIITTHPHSREALRKGRLNTVDHLINISCFVKKYKYRLRIKSS